MFSGKWNSHKTLKAVNCFDDILRFNFQQQIQQFDEYVKSWICSINICDFEINIYPKEINPRYFNLDTFLCIFCIVILRW